MPRSKVVGSARSRRAVLGALSCILALSCVAPPARAAQPRSRPAFADTTKPVMFLDEVVVTGTRYPRAYFESPQALSFVSRQTLRAQAPGGLGDVLSQLPGVESNKDGPWEQKPSIRGLSGQRVLVLVDGSPMNSVRGMGPHPSLVDPSQVERVEVVRGPSSVAYGSDAIGGVINIITRRPRADSAAPAVSGAARCGGSAGGLPARTGALELSTRWKRLSAFLSGGARRSDDFRSPDGEVPHSSYGDWNALGRLRWEPTDRLEVQGGYQLYRARNVGIPGLDVTAPGYSQTFRFKRYDRDFAQLALDHRYEESSWLATSTVRTYWQRERRNFHSDIGIAVPTGPGTTGQLVLLKDRFLDLDSYGLQIQTESRRTARCRFGAGVDASRDVPGGANVELQRMTSPYGDSEETVISSSVPTGRFDSYAGFVQGEFFLTPRWTLNAGGRYTHYRYRTDRTLMQPGYFFQPRRRDDDALSGSLGLVYSPVTDLHLTANVATGYREPNAQDLFFSGPGSVGFVIGNPDLKPERSVSFDLGLRWGPRALAVSGNLFYSTFEDLISALPVPPPPEAQGADSYQYTNVAAAAMWGGEAEAEWRPHPQWSARAVMSGTVGDITSRRAIREIFGIEADRVPLELVPPFRGSATVRWTDAGRRFWAEAGARYSWRTNRLPPVTPGAEPFSEFKKEWIVGDVACGARLESGQRLGMGVRNVANRRYRQALASVVEPGVTIWATLSAEF